MADYKNLSTLDFNDYQAFLKNYLKEQPRFKDYNFEGSNFSVLIRLLAQHAYTVGFHQNMLNSESHLDSAQLLDSVISKAKELNYVPVSRSSATAVVDIVIRAEGGPQSIIIPKYFSLQAPNGLLYATIDDTVVYSNDGVYTGTGITVAEGRVVTESFINNGTARFIINSPDVDTTSVEVEVQASSTDTTTSVWNFSEDLFGLTEDTQVWFMQGAPGGRYEIVFGNNVTGKSLELGNIVRVTYRISSGTEGNGAASFTPIRNIEGYSNIVVTLRGAPAFGGAEKEDIESIKFNAPRYYSSQGNCVSPDDYVANIKKRFPAIDKVIVYSGGELPQKRYGYTIISAKPHGADLLTSSMKDSIISYVSNINEVSITPIYMDPEFFYVSLNIKATYDISKTNKAVGQITADIMSGVKNFSDTYLNDFGASLRLSRLGDAIDRSSESVLSNETSAKIIKRLRPQIGIGQSFEINFDNALSPVDGYTITTSDFGYVHNGNPYTCYMRDDGNGNIHLYTYDVDNRPFVLVNYVGEVDYETGNVNLNAIVYSSVIGGYVSVYASTKTKDLEITKNKILTIDLRDVTITLEND